MSLVDDWIDWLGGYPFETAGAEAVESFCRVRGFCLERNQVMQSVVCTQLVFVGD